MKKSTIRDGWGILYNASLYIAQHDLSALAMLEQIRIANMESFARDWTRGSYVSLP